MHRAVPPRQTKVQLHMRQRIFLESSVKRKVQHLASIYNSKQRSRKILLYWHTLYDPESKSFYQTFCDLTSENGFVWTLLESFSLANNNHFKAQPFYKAYPVNPNSFKWNTFRLSLPIMHSTLRHSMHFRATCNFNNDGLVTTDYVRAKTTDLNILQLNSWPCVKMEYISIRGYDCYNRTAKMIQGINWHIHIDSSL